MQRIGKNFYVKGKGDKAGAEIGLLRVVFKKIFFQLSKLKMFEIFKLKIILKLKNSERTSYR